MGGDGAVTDLEGPLPASAAHWLELLEHRRLEVDLEATLERRTRAYAERLNARLALEGDRDPFDLSDDQELAAVIMLLCEAALAADEQREDASS
jgi:hypothetical protein